MLSRFGHAGRLTTVILSAFCVIGCAQISADGEAVDGVRALEHAAAILQYGPHPPGSEAQLQVGAYLIGELKSLGLEVKTDAFQPVTPEGPLQMINIWGILRGSSDDVLIVASHYDTKRFADFEFVGANDPAASAGLVLEMARVLAAHNPTPLTIWFAFFDGEEALRHWTTTDSLYGSRRFVSTLRNSGDIRKIKAMLLFDLIGGKSLRLLRETNSTPWLNDIIWAKAQQLGFSGVFTTGFTTVDDDHVPFLQAGIPAVDLIDLSYRHWHTADDTLDKLSADNLYIVGEVVRRALPDIARRLNSP